MGVTNNNGFARARRLLEDKVAAGDVGWLRSVARIEVYPLHDGVVSLAGVAVPVAGKTYHVSVDDDPALVNYLMDIHRKTGLVKALWPYEVDNNTFTKVGEGRVLSGDWDHEDVYYDIVTMERERAERFGLRIVCGGGNE